jgi:drug/metabolite transporter (DMT)-like permease
MKLRAYLLMLFVVAVWGSTFVLVKGALADATPAAFNLVRMSLAFAVLGVAYHRYWRAIQGWQVAAGALVGFCLAMGYQFQTTGLVRTTPSKSAFITGLLVVLVPLFSLIPGLRPPGAKQPRWNAFLGAAMAFIGIVLLTAPASVSVLGPASLPQQAARLLPDLSSINMGDVLTLGCAIGFALHCLALSHFSPRIGFQPLALLQVGFCAIFMALSLPLIEHPHIAWTTAAGLGASHYRRAGHCGGLIHPKLGAVCAATHAYGAAADAGTGLCMDYLVRGDRRAAWTSPGQRRAYDTGGHCADRTDADAACAYRA